MYLRSTAIGRSEKSGTTASPSREGLQRGSNTAVEWKALQFHRTLFVRSHPDQDKQSTELRNASGFAERNASTETAETRVALHGVRARVQGVRSAPSHPHRQRRAFRQPAFALRLEQARRVVAKTRDSRRSHPAWPSPAEWPPRTHALDVE